MDIHHYDRKLKSAVRGIKEAKIFQKNKSIILKFQDLCFSESIGKAKITRYLYDLRKIAIFLKKDFDKCGKEDIQGVVAKIEPTDYVYSTKRGICVRFWA